MAKGLWESNIAEMQALWEELDKLTEVVKKMSDTVRNMEAIVHPLIARKEDEKKLDPAEKEHHQRYMMQQDHRIKTLEEVVIELQGIMPIIAKHDRMVDLFLRHLEFENVRSDAEALLMRQCADKVGKK
jgi:hypothetical protein